MADRRELVSDVQLGTKFFEHPVVKLLAIVIDDSGRKLELTNDRLLEETFDFALHDVG